MARGCHSLLERCRQFGAELDWLRRHRRADLWCLEGREQHSGELLSILCPAGERNRRFLARLAFGSEAQERLIGQGSLWRLVRSGHLPGCDCALSLVEVRRTWHRLGRTDHSFFLPAWIMAEAPLPCSPAVLANPGVKSDLRRIRKAGLDYEVTRDPARMAAFYETMYVPYAGRSHGETAVVLPLERMQRKFDRCELLLVRKEGRAIAGTLIIRDEEGPRLWSLGVLDGNLEFLDYGVVGATNFFSFQHLAAQGHRRVALGFSRPFLRDGALQYKRKWGPSLTQPTPEGFSLQVHEWTPAVRSFLRNNPFVHVREESMEAAVFVEGEMPPLPADLETLKHGHLLPGLTRMAVFAMPADGRPAREMASLPFEMAPAPTAPNAGLNDNSFAAARCAGGMAPVR